MSKKHHNTANMKRISPTDRLLNYSDKPTELLKFVSDSIKLRGKEEAYKELHDYYWPKMATLHALQQAMAMHMHTIVHVLMWGHEQKLVNAQLHLLSPELARFSAEWRNFALINDADPEYVSTYEKYVADVQDCVKLALSGDMEGARDLIEEKGFSLDVSIFDEVLK